ncbi:hypothetical protein [Streptomyces sp. WM6378]|uniref:hypothetical protein n=1 Tax=Streptomyces sp. WM6378 TaxID=1415557 RepID=UPI000AD978CD|nr:hypothetical protein [Streptomyces sp. WM6378]
MAKDRSSAQVARIRTQMDRSGQNFRAARAAVLKARSQGSNSALQATVIVMTCGGANDATGTALNLGAVWAQEGQRVLVIREDDALHPFAPPRRLPQPAPELPFSPPLTMDAVAPGVLAELVVQDDFAVAKSGTAMHQALVRARPQYDSILVVQEDWSASIDDLADAAVAITRRAPVPWSTRHYVLQQGVKKAREHLYSPAQAAVLVVDQYRFQLQETRHLLTPLLGLLLSGPDHPDGDLPSRSFQRAVLKEMVALGWPVLASVPDIRLGLHPRPQGSGMDKRWPLLTVAEPSSPAATSLRRAARSLRKAADKATGRPNQRSSSAYAAGRPGHQGSGTAPE